jgi:RNA polymerase sigma factor (TIGR02999 family)
MRRVLIDHGRHQKRDKRRGRLRNVTLDDVLKGSTREIPIEDLLALEAAIECLEVVDPRAAEVVVLRFYSGLSAAEVAQHLGLSLRTVESDWTHARIWLKRALSASRT